MEWNTSVGHPVVAELALAVGRHVEHVADFAVVLENHHARGAFDDMKRFRLAEVLVRADIGVAVMHDQHLVQARGRIGMGAEPAAQPRVLRGDPLQFGDHAVVRRDDRGVRIIDLGVLRAQRRPGALRYSKKIKP